MLQKITDAIKDTLLRIAYVEKMPGMVGVAQVREDGVVPHNILIVDLGGQHFRVMIEVDQPIIKDDMV